MAEDRNLRDNRLALLKRLESLFSGVADLSQIVPGER
jgi:glycyl-tRNA synthetase beta subunit